MNDKKKAPEKKRDNRTEAQKNKDAWKLEKRENTLRFVNIVALMAVFAGITLFMTFGKRPNVSYEENRDLEKPPQFTWEEYWAGKVTDQFAKYYNDTVPMRSTWKLVIADFRDHLGIKYEGGVTIVGDIPVIEQPPKPADSTSRPANSIPDVVIKNPSSSASSANKVPDVVIPNRSTSSSENTSDPVPVEENAPDDQNNTAE